MYFPKMHAAQTHGHMYIHVHMHTHTHTCRGLSGGGEGRGGGRPGYHVSPLKSHVSPKENVTPVGKALVKLYSGGYSDREVWQSQV